MNLFIAGDIRGAYRSEELISILANDLEITITGSYSYYY